MRNERRSVRAHARLWPQPRRAKHAQATASRMGTCRAARQGSRIGMNEQREPNPWSFSLSTLLLLITGLAALGAAALALQRERGNFADFILTAISLVHIGLPIVVFMVWVGCRSLRTDTRRYVTLSATALLVLSFLVMPLIDPRRHLPKEICFGLCVWFPQAIVLISVARIFFSSQTAVEGERDKELKA